MCCALSTLRKKRADALPSRLALSMKFNVLLLNLLLDTNTSTLSAPSAFYILVVDDLSDNLFLLQTSLEAEGYNVDTADNGSSALEKVEASPPDLILMDVMMPDMNGYEVTQQIRQNPASHSYQFC